MSELSPDAVDALARELHQLQCQIVIGRDGGPDFLGIHRGTDRSKARFLLLGLRASGYELRPREQNGADDA